MGGRPATGRRAAARPIAPGTRDPGPPGLPGKAAATPPGPTLRPDRVLESPGAMRRPRFSGPVYPPLPPPLPSLAPGPARRGGGRGMTGLAFRRRISARRARARRARARPRSPPGAAQLPGAAGAAEVREPQGLPRQGGRDRGPGPSRSDDSEGAPGPRPGGPRSPPPPPGSKVCFRGCWLG